MSSQSMYLGRLAVDIRPQDHRLGPLDAPVRLVEYGDYQCPFCAQAQPIVKRIKQELDGKVCLVFRHFPLTNVHEYAEIAAEAAEAAGAQGKFWEMHDYLYEHQDALALPNLLAYADILGLDVKQFTDELRRHKYAKMVRDEFLSGVRSGVNGTPTFFINGIRHDDAWDYHSLLAAIRERLKALAA